MKRSQAMFSYFCQKSKKTNLLASAEGCTNFCPPKNKNVPQNFSQGDKLSPSDQILAQTLALGVIPASRVAMDTSSLLIAFGPPLTFKASAPKLIISDEFNSPKMFKIFTNYRSHSTGKKYMSLLHR